MTSVLRWLSISLRGHGRRHIVSSAVATGTLGFFAMPASAQVQLGFDGNPPSGSNRQALCLLSGGRIVPGDEDGCDSFPTSTNDTQLRVGPAGQEVILDGANGSATFNGGITFNGGTQFNGQVSLTGFMSVTSAIRTASTTMAR